MGLLEVAHDAIPRIGPPVLRLHQQGDQGQARRARKRPFAVMPGRLSAATVRFVPPMRRGPCASVARRCQPERGMTAFGEWPFCPRLLQSRNDRPEARSRECSPSRSYAGYYAGAGSPRRSCNGEGDREWIGTSMLQLGIMLQLGKELPRAGRVPEPRDQELAVEQELFGQSAVEVEFQLLD